MSIQLIIGKSGSGKSQYILNRIKEEISLGQKIYIITPEQFSYATEKRLLETVEGLSSINAEVISFNRIAHRMLIECGGLTKTPLSKSGKAMLVYSILDKEKKDLKFLGNSDENIELVLNTITELKKHNIGTARFKETSELIEDAYLKAKLEDIDNIYSLYNQIIENQYIDEDDNLTILSNQIDESKMFNDSLIFIDEFAGFTEQEYIVIKKLMKKAKDLCIAISADPESIDVLTKPESDIFYYNKKAIKRLIEIAEENSIEIKEQIVLKKQYRFKNDELKHLEQNIYAYPYKRYSENVQKISLFLASNPYSELENIAKNIVKLVKQEKFRYGDISVVTKNIEEIESRAKSIFQKYNIPVFIDRKEDLNQNILVKYILGVVDIFSKNWNTSSIFSYLKSGLYDEISREDIYRLENYCAKWGIKGAKWYREDWSYDQEKVDIEKLNILRRKIIEPLLDFRKELDRGKTAKDITIAVYMFIQNNKIREKLNKKIEYLININEIYIAEEYKKSFELLIDLLDEIVLVFNEQKMSFATYKNILQTGLKYSDLGKIPQAIDQVIIGDVDRSRTNKTKALFIIGLNDGIFPSKPKAEGFLNDTDRDVLKEKGIELAKNTTDSLYEDQFNIYKAFSTAEERLFLTCLSSDKDGKSLRPSILVSRIKKIFPKIEEQSDIIYEDDSIILVNSAFEQLLKNLRNFQDGEQINPVWFRVYNWFDNNDEWKPKLQKAIKGLEYDNSAENLNKQNIDRLYGDSLKTSISRLEQYRKCPFSYYLKYGLKLEEKNDFNITAIDTGSFMHEVIDEFFKRYASGHMDEDINSEQIQKIVEEIINEKLSLSKNYIFTSTPKFIVLTNRLKKVITKSIEYIVYQMKNSGFEIAGNEVEFKERIGETELTGKIDRIDIAENQEGRFIRVIDYKSSSRDIDLNEMLVGTQIQLITYIDSVSKKEEAIPAGMLYFNLIDPIIKSNKNLTDVELEEEIRKRFRMQGLILADINVIKLMDKGLEKGSSKIIPVSINSSGAIGKTGNSTVTKEEFTLLQKTANRVIKDISREIMRGNIEIKPTFNLKTKASSCKYCTYKGICGFNNNINSYAYIENKSKDEILEEIREGEE